MMDEPKTQIETTEYSENKPLSTRQKGFLLFKIYLKAMALAFTGGIAATPMLISEIVKKNQLLTNDEYLEIIALSNSLPGIIGVNNSLLTGNKIAGKFGALMALLGTILPAFFSMLVVAIIFQELPRSKYVRGAINGIRAVSVAVLLNTGIRIALRFRKNTFGILMMILALCLPLFTPISAFYTILLTGVLGILYYSFRLKKKPAPEEEK